jgi:hypothetical protein
VDTYIARLIRAGIKVAVCDQVEAASARGRQLIRREVVRLVTPGTVTEAGLLDGRLNNFLAAVWRAGDHLGVALVDVTTADFWVGEATDVEGLTEAPAPARRSALGDVAGGSPWRDWTAGVIMLGDLDFRHDEDACAPTSAPALGLAPAGAGRLGRGAILAYPDAQARRT